MKGGGRLRTVRSTGDGIRNSAGRVGTPRGTGAYVTNFEILENDFAAATANVPFCR